MATRFSPHLKSHNYAKVNGPAMIMNNAHYNDDDHNTSITASLTKNSKKQNKKKNKKKKGKKYETISSSFDDGDYDVDEEDDDNSSQTDGNDIDIDIDENAGNMNISNTIETISDDQLEDIQLNSITNTTNNLVDIHLNDDDDDIDTISHNNNNNNNGKINNSSAYYGTRLNYSESSKCNDLIWSILWIIHCIALFIILCIVWSSPHVSMPHASNGLYILLFLLAFSIIFSFIWTFLLKYCGGFIVWVLILGNLIFLIAFSSFCFIIGDRFIGIGVVFSLLFILFAIFTLCIRHKINYTIALLQLGTSILLTTPHAIFCAFSVLLMQILWMFIWGSIIVAWTAQYHHTNSKSDFNGILMILILSYIWNHQVIKNIGHTTICAVIAHWYFIPQSKDYPTLNALKRCLTTSLGSITFGSLFVNILTGIRTYLKELKAIGWCCSCFRGLIECCLSGFCDGLLEYFNIYAFAHIGIYGTTYLKSGRNTIELLTISDEYKIINSNFTEYALLCGSICGGIINGILGTWCANTMNFDVDWVVLFTCGGFMIGMSLSSTMLNAVSSCVIALFVCYAEEPSVLVKLHPEQALRLDGAKKGIA